MSDKDSLRWNRDTWDALNSHEVERWAKFLAEGVVWESGGIEGPIRGRDAVRQGMQDYFAAFPDLHFTIEQEIASGEWIVTRWWARGTHRGAWWGIAPTNKPVEVHGVTWGRVENGKWSQLWSYWDNTRLLQQLGAWQPSWKAA